MNEQLTMEMLLKLPDLVLDRTKDHNKYIRPLSAEYIKDNYYPDLKNELLEFFAKFHNRKGTVKFSITDKINWTKSADTIVVKPTRRSDSVGNIVVASIDDSKWLGNVYDSIINLSYKLTKEEGAYFVNTFFETIKEEIIAKELHIGKTKLQDFKKSCLLKVLSEVEPYMYECDEDV